MKSLDLNSILREFEECSDIAIFAGGTLSSRFLRDLLRLRSRAETKMQERRISRLIAIWRRALKRHNEQAKKFVEYDLKTGLEIK